MRFTSLTVITSVVLSCSGPQKSAEKVEQESTDNEVRINRIAAELDAVIPADASIEVLAEGFDWAEGPLWVEAGNYLLFSDIPPNRVYKWSEGSGTSIYLEPSGYTGETPRGGEPGANGLLLHPDGSLVLCQHGDRRIARMDANLNEPNEVYESLASGYDGKRFNSPNDAAFHSNGDLYFTDPPYGLVNRMDDPAKELPFQGVYRLRSSGQVDLLTDEMSRPNGIAFSPDEKTLYVANSDPEKAIWMAYDVLEDGALSNGRIFYDVTDQVGKKKGLPDGLKVKSDGTLFATGPGGVLVFTPDARLIGIIETGQATANCAFDTNQETLYITADMYLMSVKL